MNKNNKIDFKIGQKYKLKPYCDSFSHGNPGVVSEMRGFFGTWVTVTDNSIPTNMRIKETDGWWSWHEHWFECPDFKMLKSHQD